MEAEQQTDAVSNENASPAVADAAPEQQDKEHNGGYQPYVDLSDLPDDKRGAIEARMAHLSRITKNTESKLNKELKNWKELAREQSERLNELTNGFGQVVDHIKDKTFNETESSLKQQMKAAFEAGDNDKYFEIQDRLLDIKAEKKFGQKQPKEEAKPKAAQEETGPSIDIDENDLGYIDAWQREADESGRVLRPWAIDNSKRTGRTDFQFQRGMLAVQEILSDDRFGHLSIEQKMAEVDKRMGTQMRTNNQNVMGANLTGNRKNTKLTLSSEQQKIAVKMKLGGSKAKSDADHIEAYRQQLVNMKGTK